MKKIIFLANCNSPHLDRWLNLLKLMGQEVEVWSIHNCEGKDYAKQVLPVFAKSLPTILKYILAGFMIRFKKDAYILHAHNTSGYGLMALISGKKYIVTTYGTEIFSANKKNGLYRKLIQVILNQSVVITSTSEEMKEALKGIFQIPSKKIHNFSLGVDTETFFSIENNGSTDKIWVINRRMHPHYYTLESILGFVDYIEQGYLGKLVVLMGDYDQDYVKEIRNQVDFDAYNGCIELVEEFLDRKTLARFLQSATFSVSTPKSDQLSSSILESMACGTVPILSELNSYQGIIESKSCLVMTDYSRFGYKEQFIKTEQMDDKDITELSVHGCAYIKEKESSEVVKESIIQLYKVAGIIRKIGLSE